MKVSIIVPCYNVEKYLSNCINSIINQSYKQWELILVNDGSQDGSGKICDDAAKIDNRIKVIHKPNGGLSSARNVGLDIMTGEYVSFLDSDDFWHKDYLKNLMRFINEENADIAQCNFIRGIDTTFPKIDKNIKVSYYNNHSIFIKEAAKIIMCCKIYKASLFEDIRMPVGLINEDDWTTWKLYYKAKKIAVTNQPLYYYTINPNSIMGTNRKKTDLKYFGAYEERINFFLEKKEEDLEHISRLQFCKSLFLLYSNPMLTKNEAINILNKFKDNWRIISKSPYINIKYKLLFMFFCICPYISELISKYKI